MTVKKVKKFKSDTVSVFEGLSGYYHFIELQEQEAARKVFPSYDKAIAEIVRLKTELERQKIDYLMITRKQGKGRPKKIQIKGHGLFEIIESISAHYTPKPKKSGGRPRQLTLDEIAHSLRVVDAFKKTLKSHLDRRSFTDKDFITYRVDNGLNTKSWRIDKKTQEIKRERSKIKYWRDEIRRARRRKIT